MTPFWRNKNGTVKEASRWKRPGARFDAHKADRALEFIETCCRHVKGELAGQLLKLSHWQREIVRGIFGWIRSDGTRLFREVYIEVPKKNGKSTLGAALGLCLLFTDGEPGAEIYSAAAETEQAGIIFNTAKRMVEQEPDLAEVSECFRRSIVYKNSAYHVLSADADTKEGKNSHGILFDELHVQPNRELYDNLKTGTASRRQPILIMFTTAGFDKNSICWEVHEYAEKIINGTITDPQFLPIIYSADPEDDWTSPKVWKKANPNYGISVKVDYIRAACEKAKAVPSERNTFKRKHLNIWTQQDKCWMPMERWDSCALPVLPEALKGRRCFGGLDLASTRDIAALVLVFPPNHIPMKEVEVEDRGTMFKRWTVDLTKLDEPFRVLPFFWVPEDSMRERVKNDRVPYDVWVEQSLLEATPGDRIDYRYILLQIGRCRVDFDLKILAFDEYGSHKIVQDLQDDLGFVVKEEDAKLFNKPLLVRFPQGFSGMSAPMNDLMDFVLAQRIAHGGHKVLRWMANNVVAIERKKDDRIMPNKERSREKIDGIVALIMALDLAIRHGATKLPYEERDLVVL